MDLRLPSLDGIKNRFGFGDEPRGAHQRNDYVDDYGYDDYGEYGYDDGADYDDGYDSAPINWDPSVDRATRHAPLVSSTDVRAQTQYTGPRGQDQQAAGGFQPIAAPQREERRSSGLNSLFSSTSTQEIPAVGGSYAPQGYNAPGAYQAVAAIPAVDAAAPQAEEPRASLRQARILTVVKPESYNEAERIAKILKAGDVAILSLRNVTDDTLAKRILDFSFGVACALDARVECISGNVFALTRGAGLSEAEMARLRDQGWM